MEENLEVKGAFAESLLRDNKQIKKSRAATIVENAEMIYKRKVEDLELKLKQLKRDRENMLDMSPTNTQSLILASDFNAEVFVDKDIDLGLQIRNVQIMYDIAQESYNNLFNSAK